jgi:hypothetical protein
MRDFWQEWRRPLQVAGVLVGALLVGAGYLTREPRRLVWRDHGVFWAATETQATFFPESSYVVHLGAHEGATLPVYLTGFYSGGTMAMSEGEVREAIADAVRERREARLETVAGGVFTPRPVPSVRIELDFWAEGSMRTDVAVSCVTTRSASAMGSIPVQVIATSRGGHGRRAELAQHVGRQLESAAKARCPAVFAAATAPALARPSTPSPVGSPANDAQPLVVRGIELASRPSHESADARPSISAEQRARADSGRAAALARAVNVGREVTSLVVAPDTLRLSVGQVVMPEQVWRLTATRSDGTVALRVAPVFSVEDRRVARIGAEGLSATGAGVTRVLVRILSADGAAALTAGATAVVHLVVTP